jgi:hypothetical protein
MLGYGRNEMLRQCLWLGRREKTLAIWPWMERNLYTCRGDLNRFMIRSRRRSVARNSPPGCGWVSISVGLPQSCVFDSCEDGDIAEPGLPSGPAMRSGDRFKSCGCFGGQTGASDDRTLNPGIKTITKWYWPGVRNLMSAIRYEGNRCKCITLARWGDLLNVRQPAVAQVSRWKMPALASR